MKKISLKILFLGLLSIAAFSSQAHASGYWDQPLGNRGVLFDSSGAALEKEPMEAADEESAIEQDQLEAIGSVETGRSGNIGLIRALTELSR